MRKTYRFIVVLILLPAITLMLVSCQNSGWNNAVQRAESTIASTIKDADFQEMGKDEQIRYIEEKLKNLADDGVISNIEFDEDEKLFTFEYSDGSLGGVSLKEYDERLNEGSVNDKIQNQVESNTSNSDELKALVLNGFEDKPARRDYYEELEVDWEKKGLVTTVDVDVTVDDLKSFNYYDIIILAMHGSEYKSKPVLCINQKVTSTTDKQYSAEIKNKRIAKVLVTTGETQYWVFNDFFTSEYYNIESDLIFSETCKFYGCDCKSDIDASYADTLSNLSNGTGAVIGYRNSVEMEYSRDVMKSTVDNLLSGDTASTALKKALDIYGEDDDCESISDDKYKAYPILTGNSNLKIVKTPVMDFNMPTSFTTTLGELSVIEPEIIPEGADDYSIKWFSSDESVATVSPTGEAGIITTLAKGTTTITAELTSGVKTITKSTQVRVASKARDTVLVLDVSGSMAGTPMEEMKKAAIQFCNDLLQDEYNNRVGLVFYDSTIQTVDLTDDLAMLITQIEAVQAGSSTDMESGLEAADQMLKNNRKTDAIQNVVIMADGLPNVGKTSNSGSMPIGSYSAYHISVSYANAVIDTANAMMNNYNIYSLGFFHSLYDYEQEFASALMKELTNQPDGYHQVDKAEDLQFAFGDISDDISIGSKIVINIACPVDVTISCNGEALSSASDAFCGETSFGTLQLLGKNQDIKVASLDSDKQYAVELQGTGEGNMDYSVNYFDENEQLADYRSFEAVPITPTTNITTDTDNSSGDVELRVDEDGDGEVDVIWSAGAKSEGSVITEQQPPESVQPAPTPAQPTEPPAEKTNEVPIWAIAVVCAVVLIIIGGGIVVIIFATNRERGGTDLSIESVEQKAVCSICGKVHPAGEPCKLVKKEEVEKKEEPEQPPEKTPAATGVIQITSGSMKGFSVPIQDGETLYLGKDARFCNVVFSDGYPNVSRVHCAVTYHATSGRFYVVDSSTNGTYFADGKRMEKGKRISVEKGTLLSLANQDCKILLK